MSFLVIFCGEFAKTLDSFNSFFPIIGDYEKVGPEDSAKYGCHNGCGFLGSKTD